MIVDWAAAGNLIAEGFNFIVRVAPLATLIVGLLALGSSLSIFRKRAEIDRKMRAEQTLSEFYVKAVERIESAYLAARDWAGGNEWQEYVRVHNLDQSVGFDDQGIMYTPRYREKLGYCESLVFEAHALGASQSVVGSIERCITELHGLMKYEGAEQDRGFHRYALLGVNMRPTIKDAKTKMLEHLAALRLDFVESDRGKSKPDRPSLTR